MREGIGVFIVLGGFLSGCMITPYGSRPIVIVDLPTPLESPRVVVYQEGRIICKDPSRILIRNESTYLHYQVWLYANFSGDPTALTPHPPHDEAILYIPPPGKKEARYVYYKSKYITTRHGWRDGPSGKIALQGGAPAYFHGCYAQHIVLY